jgi:hypothetical protein
MTTSINEKQEKLSKLLFKRHKKKYMSTRKDQEEETKMFGERHSQRNSHPSPSNNRSVSIGRPPNATDL